MQVASALETRRPLVPPVARVWGGVIVRCYLLALDLSHIPSVTVYGPTAVRPYCVTHITRD